MAATPDSGAVTQPARPSAGFRVQIAAVSTQAAADAAAAEVKALGMPVVTVREDGLYKVRAGAFATRAEAQAAAVRIKGRIGGSPFPVAEP